MREPHIIVGGSISVVEGTRLSTKDNIDTVEDESELSLRYPSNSVRQDPAIDRDDLRNVGDRILRQTGLSTSEGNVAWGDSPT